jgi:hypothetical protein
MCAWGFEKYKMFYIRSLYEFILMIKRILCLMSNYKILFLVCVYIYIYNGNIEDFLNRELRFIYFLISMWMI